MALIVKAPIAVTTYQQGAVPPSYHRDENECCRQFERIGAIVCYCLTAIAALALVTGNILYNVDGPIDVASILILPSGAFLLLIFFCYCCTKCLGQDAREGTQVVMIGSQLC